MPKICQILLNVCIWKIVYSSRSVPREGLLRARNWKGIEEASAARGLICVVATYMCCCHLYELLINLISISKIKSVHQNIKLSYLCMLSEIHKGLKRVTSLCVLGNKLPNIHLPKYHI